MLRRKRGIPRIKAWNSTEARNSADKLPWAWNFVPLVGGMDLPLTFYRPVRSADGAPSFSMIADKDVERQSSVGGQAFYFSVR